MVANNKIQKIRNSPKKSPQKGANKHTDKDYLEIKKEVENFLKIGGQEELTKLVNFVKSLGKNQTTIKQLIKQAISENIKKSNPTADQHEVAVNSSLQFFAPLFDGATFLERNWRFTPYILKSKDYRKIMQAEKRLIFVRNYDYMAPIFTFENNFQFKKSAKTKNNKTFNDLQFYINKDGNMVFAKISTEEYTPISKKLISQEVAKTEDDKELRIYNPCLYNKNITVSMYCLLEGDPQQAHSFMRYDGGGDHPHHNMFLPSDHRREVFGDIAQMPHFHFQNEDDNLLCSKKVINSDKKTRWKTGRCNAIDVDHLIKYLIDLDNCSQEEVEKYHNKDKHYNMPFLAAKFQNKSFNVETNLDEYLNSLSEKNREIIFSIIVNVKSNMKQLNYNPANSSFKKLVYALQFVKEIYEQRKERNSCEELKILSQLELIYSNAIVDSICNNQNKVLYQDYKPRYIIEGSHLKHDKELDN